VSGRRILPIFRKDLRETLRDSRLLLALVVPLMLGLLYSVMFPDDSRPEATLGYVAAAASELPEAVQAAAQDALDLELVRVGSEEALRARIADDELDVGLVIPPGFDAELAAGASPTLTVVLPSAPSFGGDYAAALLTNVLETQAGREPPAVVDRVQLPPDDDSVQAGMQALGQRKVFILLSLLLLLAMVAAYGLPVSLTEETEKRTLEALTLVASTAEVIAAKALFGLVYALASVPLLLLVTRVVPQDVPLFVADMVMSALVLVGLGLFMGSLFRTQAQLSTWSGLFMIPLLAPLITLGLPVPDAVDAVLFVVPTTQTLRLGVNAFAGDEVFGGQALSFAILAAWALGAYAVLWWWLRRREAE
jgi:ABC-2 type transport system permease protein